MTACIYTCACTGRCLHTDVHTHISATDPLEKTCSPTCPQREKRNSRSTQHCRAATPHSSAPASATATSRVPVGPIPSLPSVGTSLHNLQVVVPAGCESGPPPALHHAADTSRLLTTHSCLASPICPPWGRNLTLKTNAKPQSLQNQAHHPLIHPWKEHHRCLSDRHGMCLQAPARGEGT